MIQNPVTTYTAFIPEIIIALLAIILLFIDLINPKKTSFGSTIAFLGAITSLLSLFYFDTTYSSNLFLHDNIALFFRKFFVLVSIFLLFLSIIGNKELDIKSDANIIDYLPLLFIATLSGMFLVSSINLISIFLSLELMTITLYVLVGFYRKSSSSIEASIKYFIINTFTSAFLLFGIAWLFGFTGNWNIANISSTLITIGAEKPYFLLLSFIFILVPILLKMSIFPFHIWSPDVYQGAPTSTTGFLAIVSKSAGVIVLIRILSMLPANSILQIKIFEICLILSILSILYGSFATLKQKNFLRILAFSGISHTGFILLGIISIYANSHRVILFENIFFYLFAYFLSIILALICLAILSPKNTDDYQDFLLGLFNRSPLLATALTISLISMAGIPITAGFLGKFFILFTSLQAGFYYLTILAIVGSLVSLYYYSNIIRHMFSQKEKYFLPKSKITFPPIYAFVIYILIFLIVAFGIYPQAIFQLS